MSKKRKMCMEQKINKKILWLMGFFLISMCGSLIDYTWKEANQSHYLNIPKIQELTVRATTTNERYMLIPGGEAIGIKIQTEGLVVVDTYLVETENGNISPAREAGILKGDVIVAVGEENISTVEEYKEILMRNQQRQSLTLTINRKGMREQVIVKPVLGLDGIISTGLYLRNKLAGIGTLTYIDPNSGKYGALGHEIIDQDTNQLVKVHNGEIINSNVTAIKKARSGNPGEKVADILFEEKLGVIKKNNQFGIYGEMETNSFEAKTLLPIAYVHEVKKGDAQILTVLNGKKIETFDIEITEVNLQEKKAIKGLKYVVTDKRLLKEAGGIVQGMSGSPIIQDGKIIGAVTHVLVHDCTQGYGVFIEWMLQESEINYQRFSTNKKVV